MKKIITLLLALVLTLCAPVCALAATPDESDFLSRYAQEPYVITDCQMQVVVSEYNVLAVTETYQVYFNEPVDPYRRLYRRGHCPGQSCGHRCGRMQP